MEEWRDVPGWEGYYQVSNKGNVRSLDRYVYYRKYKDYRLQKGKIMAKKVTTFGYEEVGFTRRGSRKYFLVHRLVLLAFKGKCPEGKEVNHKDEIKTNNNLGNLEYVTSKENSNYGSRVERITHTNKRTQAYPVEMTSEVYPDFKMYFLSSNGASRNTKGFLDSAEVSRCCMGVRGNHKGFLFRRINDIHVDTKYEYLTKEELLKLKSINRVWDLMRRGIVVEDGDSKKTYFESYEDAYIKTDGNLKENGLRNSIVSGKLYKGFKVRRLSKKEAEEFGINNYM